MPHNHRKKLVLALLTAQGLVACPSGTIRDEPSPVPSGTASGADAPAAAVSASPVEPDAVGCAMPRYPRHLAHSPMTRPVVERLSAVIGTQGSRHDVFAKVGDSITAHGHFLKCFAGNDLKWGDHAVLEPTRAYFLQTRADASRSSFERVSLAARSGWSTSVATRGRPSPIDREFAAIRPAFAVVMMGTNDVYPEGVGAYERNLRTLVDRTLSSGVVPLLSTIPPMTWSAKSNAQIPEMNAVVAAVAQSRMVPLMDYHGAIASIAGSGLGKDGIHPEAWRAQGLARPCWFTPEALHKGINARNLIVLQSLDRVRRFLVDRQAPESEPPALSGTGTSDDPLLAPELPFSDARRLAAGCSRQGSIDAAAATQQFLFFYRLRLDKRERVRVRVFGDDAVRVAVSMGEPGVGRPAPSRDLADALAGPGDLLFEVRAWAESAESAGATLRVTAVALAP